MYVYMQKTTARRTQTVQGRNSDQFLTRLGDLPGLVGCNTFSESWQLTIHSLCHLYVHVRVNHIVLLVFNHHMYETWPAVGKLECKPLCSLPACFHGLDTSQLHHFCFLLFSFFLFVHNNVNLHEWVHALITEPLFFLLSFWFYFSVTIVYVMTYQTVKNGLINV